MHTRWAEHSAAMLTKTSWILSLPNKNHKVTIKKCIINIATLCVLGNDKESTFSFTIKYESAKQKTKPGRCPKLTVYTMTGDDFPLL